MITPSCELPFIQPMLISHKGKDSPGNGMAEDSVTGRIVRVFQELSSDTTPPSQLPSAHDEGQHTDATSPSSFIVLLVDPSDY